MKNRKRLYCFIVPYSYTWVCYGNDRLVHQDTSATSGIFLFYYSRSKLYNKTLKSCLGSANVKRYLRERLFGSSRNLTSPRTSANSVSIADFSRSGSEI